MAHNETMTINGEEMTVQAFDSSAQDIDDAVVLVKNGVIQPIIKGGTWWTWSVTAKDYVNTGVSVQGEKGEPGKRGISIYRANAYGAGATVAVYSIGNLDLPEGLLPEVNDLVVLNDGYLAYVSRVDEAKYEVEIALCSPEICLIGEKGDKGSSVTVRSVSESTEDGGTNVVTFSDGDSGLFELKVKNGSKGNTPVKGTDYWTPEDQEEMARAAYKELVTQTNWQATKTEVDNSAVEILKTTISFTDNMSVLQVGTIELEPGIAYIVEWKGATYECVCHSGDALYIGNGTLSGESLSNGEPFCITWYEGTKALYVYKETSTAEDVSFGLYAPGTTVFTYSKLPDEHLPESCPHIILRSSTEGSTKLFKLTVDDTGTMRLAEVTE